MFLFRMFYYIYVRVCYTLKFSFEISSFIVRASKNFLSYVYRSYHLWKFFWKKKNNMGKMILFTSAPFSHVSHFPLYIYIQSQVLNIKMSEYTFHVYFYSKEFDVEIRILSFEREFMLRKNAFFCQCRND